MLSEFSRRYSKLIIASVTLGLFCWKTCPTFVFSFVLQSEVSCPRRVVVKKKREDCSASEEEETCGSIVHMVRLEFTVDVLLALPKIDWVDVAPSEKRGVDEGAEMKLKDLKAKYCSMRRCWVPVWFCTIFCDCCFLSLLLYGPFPKYLLCILVFILLSLGFEEFWDIIDEDDTVDCLSSLFS